MIESELKYTRENVGEFVKYNIFGKSKASKVYVICYLVAMALIGAVGIVLAIVTQMWWFICYGYLNFAYSCYRTCSFGNA